MENNKIENIRFSGFTKRSLVTLLVMISSGMIASAQKSVVADVLSKHGIDQSVLEPANLRVPDDYSYTVKESTTTNGKTKEVVAKFDPSQQGDEQWTVISVDNNLPSRSDINSFRKNKAKKQSANKTDDASFKIEKDAADQIVFSYKADASSISKDAEFLKDCRVFVTINTGTKQPERQQIKNEKPVKLGPLKADRFEVVTNFIKKDPGARYFPASESVSMDSKFLGQAVSVQTATEYSNYSKK
ncbi:hypothetical protein MTO98_15790 [Mucilaginibacter sp. SMC90]|uniref:hypothetical protein n=1 Tax=Mucilaginibacter sp. SMC90 TaxID=2929803 RepID=UPI001FB526B8|nr:hypothetical protein [Mucilaginibacter sp. SMC90]UOE52538.1 hypothetical protein MTO98_15790 [Mucilaginibacter sp. SMC90]